MKHIIVYFSPAGSTRLIAETIHRRLTEHGQEVVLIDLTAKNRTTEEKTSLVDPPCCLWTGSPVYCDHAVPLVADFIDGLPFGSSRSYAVPFVTWGGVTSGLSLLEMAGQLQKKNFIPLAAAKVLLIQPIGHSHDHVRDRETVCGVEFGVPGHFLEFQARP